MTIIDIITKLTEDQIKKDKTNENSWLSNNNLSYNKKLHWNNEVLWEI